MALAQTRVTVFAFNTTTSLPVEGDAANITAKWSKDYVAPVALTDTNPVEAEDGGGFYYFDLTVDERTLSIEGRIFPVSSTNEVQVIGIPQFFMSSGSVNSVISDVNSSYRGVIY